MKKIIRKLTLGIAVSACALLLAVPTMAVTHKNTKTITAGTKGTIYYVLDQKIAEHGITANQVQIEPQTANTMFDVVLAAGTSASPSIQCVVGRTTKLTSQATNAYIKSSSGADSGAVCGIRVSRGSVKLTVYSTSNLSAMGLVLVNREYKYTPLRGQTIPKGRSINFAMTKGNVANIPLIFGGTKGSKIKRTLSSTKYEVYSFGSSKMMRTVYTNGVKGASIQISYHSTYTTGGKKYLCTLIPIPASAQSKSTGWMKNTKGNVAFFYMRDFLGMKKYTR
ncbi:MAG: hypothetical protein IIZ39_12505 [Blautia sp.]|nr:hypothetical protein [Blautia sp.]